MLNPMIALQAIRPEKLCEAVPALTLTEARKTVSAVHRFDRLPDPCAGIRRSAREAVRATGCIPVLELVAERKSTLDPFVKYLLGTADSLRIETVRIPLERSGRFSVCVSSQIGCALACAFCATGRMGLRRNLETWEIVEQVRVVRRRLEPKLKERVHGVVFQGMGEPLANLERVIEAIRVMSEPSALALDARCITVCTAGIPSGILQLAREVPKVRLGISIGSPHPEVRRRLMPIDLAYSLDEVLDAAAEHARITGLAPMWAYTLLAGVNDALVDARVLGELARNFALKTGIRPRISIVPYNSIATDERDPFGRVSEERECLFRQTLHEAGIGSRKRYSGGADMDAACGQLAAREFQ
jgi:23S rRNA (adenine2503-C2)-methyltransferase